MPAMPSQSALVSVVPGSHTCALYATDAEFQTLLVDWLLAGLEQNQKCFCLAALAAGESLAQWAHTRLGDPRLAPALARGQLVCLAAEEFHLQNGRFDQAALQARLGTELGRALAEGYTALRTLSEMGGLLGQVGIETLLESEARMNQLLAGQLIVALCAYDQRRFAAETLLEGLHTHPWVIAGGEVCHNPYYSPPDEYLGQSPAQQILDRQLGELAEHSRQEVELAAIYDHTPLMLLLLDSDARVLKANRAVAERAGRPPAALAGIYCGEVLQCAHAASDPQGCGRGPDCAACSVRQAVQETLATGQAWQRREACLLLGQSEPPAETYLLISTSRLEVHSQPAVLVCLEDMTERVHSEQERQQAEAALRASEQKLRSFIEQSADAVTLTDEAGRVVEWNQASEQMTKLKRADVLNQFIWDVQARMTPPAAQDLVQMWKTSVTAALQTGQSHLFSHPFETAAQRLDGTSFASHIVIFPVRTPRGFCLGSIARDITQRKQAEEQLERFFHLVPDMVCIASTDGYFQKVNAEWQRVLGYSMEELLATPYAEFIHPADREPTAREVQRQLAGASTAQFVNRYRAKDGTYHWLEWNATPAVESHLLFAAARDITARKEAEAALRESEERFRSVAETATDGIITINPAGQIVQCNQAAETMFGYPAEKMLHQPLADLMPPAYHPAHLQGLARASQTGTLHLAGQTVELTARRRDGSLFPIELTIAQWQSAETRFFTAIIRDITARKQAEDQIYQLNAELEHRVADRTAELQRANAELLRASRLKDEFLANMSHELRTPLTSILGLAEALQMGTYGPLPDKQFQRLQIIRQSGQHLLALITDILDLAKIEADRVQLELGPVPVVDVCQASLQFIKQTAEKKKLRVTLVHDPHVGLLQADARRLKQMLVNLLGNAVKFTPEGGQVGLEVTGDAQQGEVHFSVWDTGIGIPADKLGLLFQPFVQVDGSLARKYEGAGLGLALTRRLAEMHGGGVTAQSAGPGQGSRFTVTLPWHPAPPSPRFTPEPAPAPAALVTPGGRPALVLVADDNEANLLAVCSFVESLSATVAAAHTGREALTLATANPPDLILMDIQMPDMDGLETIRRLRARPETAPVPIIALTALAMPGDRERCLAAGATDYVSKPIVLADLGRAILRQLRAKDLPNR